ncbi:hypothetical protein [Sulfobacillus thermosulfidooxidans]|uniref:hypothetical protein n=1 Tax=Sulfobacillus thermosulfidooxidans TaxID=28034 RepID=UPI00096BA792|nr:hypothetical protein [Sulfobacillus thermosulfidooxidans]OLZ09215.1 hypothetical protein BFX05_14520 [Sulfobacillus thermosulfidooxidans]OLZ17780.1 hypothetical protein BFX06_12505 [Sulfobacillus thermosulfidooxidans]OLZ22326.1 hypothetical protein BFX07_09460 [Sulfobacillus thermosulfidooxidans]
MNMTAMVQPLHPSTTQIFHGILIASLLMVGIIGLAWGVVTIERVWSAVEMWRDRTLLHATYRAQGPLCVLRSVAFWPFMRKVVSRHKKVLRRHGFPHRSSVSWTIFKNHARTL